MDPMPNDQYTNNKNIVKLFEAIIGKSSELPILSPNIQANIAKINNKHDKITNPFRIILADLLF